MNETNIWPVCSGDGPIGQMYGECSWMNRCGAAMEQVPTQSTLFAASSLEKLWAWIGPPMTANTCSCFAASELILALEESDVVLDGPRRLGRRVVGAGCLQHTARQRRSR